jgi:ABC-2 type transport system ATP-binding protein
MTQPVLNKDAALVIKGLTKHYPIPKQRALRVALNDLTLSVDGGQIFGFLGPNGAGKTTTIKMLLGFIRPTSGDAWLFGKHITDDNSREKVGYVPEQPYFPKFLTALETVRAHGVLSNLSGREAAIRADKALEQVNLFDFRYSPLSKLSKGQTQRVALASALIGDPTLLILDEPSSGLDPVGRKELRDLLQQLKTQGKTIFLSSHLLSEMESVCDQVGVLALGKLVACGRPSEIVQARDQVAVEIEQAKQDDVLAKHVADWGGEIEQSSAGSPRLLVPSARLDALINLIQQGHGRLLAVTPQRETLEDAFLRLVS